MKLWIERVLIGLFAVVALGVPLIVGFMLYLGFSDGILLNEGDPTRQTHIFLVRESRNFGVGMTSPVEVASPAQGTRCVRTQFTHLRLRGSIRIERSGDFCACYTQVAGGWTQSSASCKV